MANKVTLYFPSKYHANAFAQWAETAEAFEDYFKSDYCKQADELTKEEIGDIEVEFDEKTFTTDHQIYLS